MAKDIDEQVAPHADSFPADDERPCWRVYDQGIKHDGKKYSPGVYWHDSKHGGKGSVSASADTWACGPLHVEAITTNAEDGEHGRLLRYLSATGVSKKWAMPMEMLAGNGNEVRRVLLDNGLLINPERRGLIVSYLSSQRPRKRLMSTPVEN